MGTKGNRGKQELKFSEKSIQRALYANFLSPNTKKYEMYNLFVYDWESDYLAITKSNYAYEVEIKISRSDFFNDFKHKKRKHILLEERVDFPHPNYFYYAVPNGMIKPEEVPEYAGLIYVNGIFCQIIKEAPKINKEPADIDNLNLINKFYYAYINWRDKYEKDEISKLKSHIKALEKDIMSLDNLLSEANSEIDSLKNEIKKRDSRTCEGKMPL